MKITLLEKRCQKYELYQLDEDSELFFIIELWKSEKRYNAHLENEAFITLCTEMQEFVEIKVSNPLKLTKTASKW